MSTTLKEHIAETITEELRLFAEVLVTDVPHLAERGVELGAVRVVVVEEPTTPLAESWPLILSAAKAGKPVRTWCTATERGRRVARAAARTLDPILPNGERVRHVTSADPQRWQPLVTPWSTLAATAQTTLPPAPRGEARSNGAAAGVEVRPYDTSPAEIARRIILRFGGELLVVAPSQHYPKAFSTGYALDAAGIWCAGGDPWARWLRKISDDMVFEVATSGLAGKALSASLSQVYRIKRPSLVEDVRKNLRSELDELREQGEPCADVTECRAEQLDSNMRFIGALNGVIDLVDGSLLTREQGRKYWVTVRTPVEFDPDATHPAVDRLFAHLGAAEARWWWSVLGSALRTVPKRLYAAVGAPSGGKSTLLNALNLTLGPYVHKAARGVLSIHNRASETQLTPGLLCWFMPTRLVLIEEERRRQTLDAGLTKDLTGGGFLSARGIRQDLRERKVGATTIMFSNTDSVPRLSLETEGMQDRYRELPYPPVPEEQRDGKLRDETTADNEFQSALLTRLVSMASSTPEPPDDIPAVSEATRSRVREDAGEIGAFATRLVRGGGDVLTFSAVWEAWCLHNDEPLDSREPGGVGKRRLTGALRDHVDGLPAPTQIRKKGMNARGWRAWRLLDEVPDPEAQPAVMPAGTVPVLDDDTVFQLGGESVTGRELLRRLRSLGAGWRLHVEAGIAMIEQVFVPDTATAPLPFADGEDDPHPKATEASAKFNGLF